MGPAPRPPTPPPQELCKQLHAKIDAAEEEKYDMEIKVQKSTKEVRGRAGAGAGRAPHGPGFRASPPLAHVRSWRT